MVTTRNPERVQLVRARLTADERGRWTAALEPGETLSGLIRTSVEQQLRRREEAQEVEVERQASDRFGLDELLERAQQ